MYNKEIQKIKVDLNETLCDDFLGLSAVYHGFNYNKEYEMRGYTAADREVEYKRLKETRVKIVRSWFYPNYNCADICGPYDMKCQRMEAMRKWCQDMKDMEIDIAFQAGWHFPDNLYYGHEKPDDKVDAYNYANWAAETFKYLIVDCGLDNIKYAILFTEPTGNGMCEQEGLKHWNRWDYYAHTIRILDKVFKEKGIRHLVKFVGPNNSAGGLHLENAVRDLNDVIDIYSGHDYNYNRQYHWENMARRMSEAVKSTGKPFWMDEYGMQMDTLHDTAIYGAYIAQIVSASISCGHQTPMIWTLFDQLFPSGTPFEVPENATDDGSHNMNRDGFMNGVHHWGVTTFPCDDIDGAGSVYPSYYAYVMLSKALGGKPNEGKVRTVKTYHATTLYSAASVQGEDFSILAVNSNPRKEPVIIEGLPEGKTLYKHVFDPYSRLPEFGTANKPLKHTVTNGEVTTVIPDGGFVIFSTREVL